MAACEKKDAGVGNTRAGSAMRREGQNRDCFLHGDNTALPLLLGWGVLWRGGGQGAAHFSFIGASTWNCFCNPLVVLLPLALGVPATDDSN